MPREKETVLVKQVHKKRIHSDTKEEVRLVLCLSYSWQRRSHLALLAGVKLK